jgi:hypothetical protein
MLDYFGVPPSLREEAAKKLNDNERSLASSKKWEQALLVKPEQAEHAYL